MLMLNKNKIVRFSISLTIILFTWGCVNSKDIHWENTPINGTVLGTHEIPRQYGPSSIRIMIKLDSGETVLVPSTREILIIKGQEIKIRRGTTDSGKKFYSLVR